MCHHAGIFRRSLNSFAERESGENCAIITRVKRHIFAAAAALWAASAGWTILHAAHVSKPTAAIIASPADSADIWERVVRRLHAGTMPPQPARRPDAATYERLISWLEGELDRAAAAAPNPGRPVLHRLNRAEYANAIHDVLAIDVDVASLLPPDDSAYGFDNISDVLGVSPSLPERYLAAATSISALAVGDPDIRPGSQTYTVRQDLSQ